MAASPLAVLSSSISLFLSGMVPPNLAEPSTELRPDALLLPPPPLPPPPLSPPLSPAATAAFFAAVSSFFVTAASASASEAWMRV